MLVNLLTVAAGSAAGGVLRYFIAYLNRSSPSPLPWWTLLVNVAGGFIIGMAAVLMAESERGRLLLMAGFCGGFTTFSAFSLETLALMQSGSSGLALVNILLNVILSIAACWAGSALALRMG